MADHFDPDLLDLMARRREVTIETARASGEPRRTVIWIVVVGGDAYVRSVRGTRGAWFRELTQQGSAALRVAGRVVAGGRGGGDRRCDGRGGECRTHREIRHRGLDRLDAPGGDAADDDPPPPAAVIAFLTGGGGFIGTAVARQLRARGEAVRALVRDPARASVLRDLGCELAAGDLADVARLSAAMAGADLVIHLAGVYRVGIADRERPAMYAANVTGTEHALDAAIAAGVPRIVDVSTINAFGDTGGRVVDETYVRPRPYRYVSYYDETKHLGHLAAEDTAARRRAA